MEVKHVLFLCLFAAAGQRSSAKLGAPENISTDDPNLQPLVLNATATFNRQINDLYLFRPTAINAAQRQLVTGVLYIIDFNVTRTVCRKRGNENQDVTKCDVQPEGRLHQTRRCHAKILSISWKQQIKTKKISCR
ncbi:unnamed protein product [Ophioblennius macclurei]